MSEKQPRVEMHNHKLKTTYDSFVNLVSKYGQTIDEGGTVFKKYIQNPDNSIKIDNLLSGRFFGKGSNTIQIFYRIDNLAAEITLTKEATNEVLLSQFTLFETQLTNKGNILIQKTDQTQLPDIDSLNLLIKKTELACVQERHKLKARLEIAAGLRIIHKDKIKREIEKRDKRK